MSEFSDNLPLNCVKKPKYVHRIRDSSQKRGWNGTRGTVPVLTEPPSCGSILI